MVYIYPAIFTQYDSDVGITFPDLDGCVSQGDNYLEAFRSAYEGLALHLYGMIEDGEELPPPSRLEDIALEKNQALALIEVDLTDFAPDWELDNE